MILTKVRRVITSKEEGRRCKQSGAKWHKPLILAMTDFLSRSYQWIYIVITLYPASVGALLRYNILYNLTLPGLFPL